MGDACECRQRLVRNLCGVLIVVLLPCSGCCGICGDFKNFLEIFDYARLDATAYTADDWPPTGATWFLGLTLFKTQSMVSNGGWVPGSRYVTYQSPTLGTSHPVTGTWGVQEDNVFTATSGHVLMGGYASESGQIVRQIYIRDIWAWIWCLERSEYLNPPVFGMPSTGLPGVNFAISISGVDNEYQNAVSFSMTATGRGLIAPPEMVSASAAYYTPHGPYAELVGQPSAAAYMTASVTPDPPVTPTIEYSVTFGLGDTS